LDPLCKEIGMKDRSNMVKVAVVGGEGIGPEVTAQSHRILNWFAAKRGVPVTLREAQYGLIPNLATGRVVLPEDPQRRWTRPTPFSGARPVDRR